MESEHSSHDEWCAFSLAAVNFALIFNCGAQSPLTSAKPHETERQDRAMGRKSQGFLSRVVQSFPLSLSFSLTADLVDSTRNARLPESVRKTLVFRDSKICL